MQLPQAKENYYDFLPIRIVNINISNGGNQCLCLIGICRNIPFEDVGMD